MFEMIGRGQSLDSPRCDHICLRDAGHVDRGEAHFHGYELPSPRAQDVDKRDWVLTGQKWMTLRDALEKKLARPKSDPSDNRDQGYDDALRWVIEQMSGEEFNDSDAWKIES